MIIINDKNLEIAYDHYKDTVQYLKEDLKKRDKLILILLVLICFYFFIELKTDETVDATNIFITSKMGINYKFNYDILIIANLLFILIVELKYFQLCIYIERQYEYLSKLEDTINSIMGTKIVTREGFSYLNEYPLLSAFIHRIYNYILPFGIILTFFTKLQNIIIYFLKNKIFYSVSMILIFLILICSFLYLLFINRDGEKTQIINMIVKKIFIFLHLYKED